MTFFMSFLGYVNHLTTGKKLPSGTRVKSIVLTWNAGGIGDWIMFSPALRTLRRNYSSARIILYVSEQFYSRIEGHLQYVDDIHIIPMNFGRSDVLNWLKFLGFFVLRLPIRYDLLVNGYSVGGRMVNMVTALTRAKFKIGFDWNDSHLLYNETLIPVDGEHLCDQNLKLCAVLDCELSSTRTIFEVSKKAAEEADAFWRIHELDNTPIVIGVHPRTKVQSKNWSLHEFSLLLNEIRKQHNAKFVVFGNASDAELVSPLLKDLGDHAVLQAGGSGLDVAAALLQRCSMLVSVDSGIMHLARAVGTPLFSIFISTDPVLYGYDDEISKSVRLSVNGDPQGDPTLRTDETEITRLCLQHLQRSLMRPQ